MGFPEEKSLEVWEPPKTVAPPFKRSYEFMVPAAFAPSKQISVLSLNVPESSVF